MNVLAVDWAEVIPIIIMIPIGLVLVALVVFSTYARWKDIDDAEEQKTKNQAAAESDPNAYAEEDAWLLPDFLWKKYGGASALRVENVIATQLSNGRIVTSFTTVRYSNRETYRQEYTGIYLGGKIPSLPPMRLVRQTPNNVDGFNNDLLFESDEFNQKFFVDAHDPRIAHSLITPLLMQYLLDTSGKPGGGFLLTSGWLIVENTYTIADNPLTVTTRVGDQLQRLLEQFPTHILEQWEITPDRYEGNTKETVQAFFPTKRPFSGGSLTQKPESTTSKKTPSQIPTLAKRSGLATLAYIGLFLGAVGLSIVIGEAIWRLTAK